MKAQESAKSASDETLELSFTRDGFTAKADDVTAGEVLGILELVVLAGLLVVLLRRWNQVRRGR